MPELCVVGPDRYRARVEYRAGGVTIDYLEHGSGVPLVALHGAGVDHREVEIALEAIVPDAGLRRIYPDLPGMGRSTSGGLAGNDDVVRLLADFIDQVAGEPVLLLGHSYGALLARGVAARNPNMVLGLALLCPIVNGATDVPEHEVVRQDADAYANLDPAQRAGFDDYFVVRTAITARRYRDAVVPGKALVDADALGRIFAEWAVDVGSGTFSAPTLIASGRRDSTVGYAGAQTLIPRYPRATCVIVEDAGHALMHERPEVVGPLLIDWLRRARPDGR